MLWGLRWLAVIVFVILFIVGILVELPWKIMVCLAIIPIVGIFFPKRIQPLAWLVIALMTVGAFVWVVLPGSDSSDWSVYQYDYEFEKLLTVRQIDGGVNAAIQYQALFDTYDESIFSHPFLSEEVEDALYNRPWDEEEFPLMAEWISDYQSAIDTLLDITQLPECCFAIPKTLSETNVQMKRLNQMKFWARLLLWSANMDIAEGNLKTALDKQQAVLRMAQHLYQQQTLLDQAAAFEIEVLAFRAQCLFAIEHCDTTDTLDAIEQDFERIDTGWAKSWAAIVEHEKLIFKNIMGLLYETNGDGDTRIARSAMYALQEGLGYRPRKLFFHQHEMNRLTVIGLWLSLPTSPEDLAKLIDKRFDYYSLMAQKGAPLPAIPIQYSWRTGLNIRSLIDWFAIDRVRYFWALHGQHRRHESIVNLVRIFTALKKYYLRYHEWPETLDTLTPNPITTIPIDMVHGKPFVYQKTDTAFRLYSLGPNGIDDDGVNNPPEHKDDILFWPRLIVPESFNDGIIAEKRAQKP